jgi:hypothetical protein
MSSATRICSAPASHRMPRQHLVVPDIATRLTAHSQHDSLIQQGPLEQLVSERVPDAVRQR